MIKRILVSQPPPAIIEKSPYYELMQKHGVAFDFVPFIKVEGVAIREFRSQRVEILEHTAIIFTSRTTIDHFFRICEESRVTMPETMKYLCNTETVALYLQKYIVYRKRKIFFADGTFNGMMELILKHKEEKMLLTLSEPYKTDMITAMEKLKLRFSKVVLSRAASRDVSAVRLADYDLAVFYASAEITTLVAAFPGDTFPMVATFGSATARAAVEAGISLRAMAPTPEALTMTRALDTFIKKVNAGEDVLEVTLGHNTQAEEFVKAQEAKPGRKSRSKGAATAKKPAAKIPATEKKK